MSSANSECPFLCFPLLLLFKVHIETPLPQGRLTPSPHRMRRLRIPNSTSKLNMTLNASYQRLNSPKALIPVFPTVQTTLRTFDCLETQLVPCISKEHFKFSGMSLQRTTTLYNKLFAVSCFLAAIHPPPQGLLRNRLVRLGGGGFLAANIDKV